MFTTDKRLVLWTFVFMFVSFLAMGFFMEKTVQVSKYGADVKFEQALPVEFKPLGEKASSSHLKAEIKGSVYETGSNMTVFGACFDGDGYLLPAATATFTAWYPDGTIATGPNASMFIVSDYSNNTVNSTGRWGIHEIMGSTIGTYLTEIRCDYAGQWATAYGEWQNPEWVKRIGDTQQTANFTYDLLKNVSSVLANFKSNITNILNGSVTVNVDLSKMTQAQREQYDLTKLVDAHTWTIDGTNPFFVLGSGVHQFSAVDMLGVSRVAAVSTDGYYVYWDGETWNEVATNGTWYGVSLVPANAVYGWLAGTVAGTPAVSINGATPTAPSLPSGSPTAFLDIRAFQDPNDPSGNFYVYLLGNDGTVYLSNDTGATYGARGSVGSSNATGRISEVVMNYVNAQPVGYLAMFGEGNTVATDNGQTFTSYVLPGQVVKDVGLLYADFGYVVAKSVSDSRIYRYNGTGLVLDYVINDSTIVPTGVSVNGLNDVWVTTSDPGTFYHFDGYRWKYATFGSSDFISIVINFGNATNTGIRDFSMSDPLHGYAVGYDGLIMKYQARTDSEFDEIEGMLKDMNVTMNYKLDTLLSNVTYSQLYMETTLFPIMNATYQNTLQILVALGLMDAKLNTTIELQNQTLNLTQNINANVETLLNKSSRIRAWVTQ